MRYCKQFIIIIGIAILIMVNISATENKYTDIKSKDWFYDDVMALSALNIMEGYIDNTFQPRAYMTCAEFTKCILLAIDADITESSGDSSSQAYIDYALHHKIITREDINNKVYVADEPITRSYMTRMLILALDIEIARVDNPFYDKSDIYMNTAYNEYLLRGIYDKSGRLLCNMESYATRGEIATIINRAIKYMKDPYEYKKTAILENASTNVLSREAEILDLFYIMNREFITEYTFNSTYTYKELTDLYHVGDSMFLQYFQANKIKITYYDDSNTFTLELIYTNDLNEIIKRTNNSVVIAKSVLASIIKDDMSAHDKVKAIHDYIALNCEYDYANYLTNTLPEASYRIYGVFEEKKAVCQGYCAAFNLLCEMAGIRALSVCGDTSLIYDSHSWNVVLINDVLYYVDVTFDDPVPDKPGSVKYTYFMLTESEMEKHGYTWEKTYTNIKYFY